MEIDRSRRRIKKPGISVPLVDGSRMAAVCSCESLNGSDRFPCCQSQGNLVQAVSAFTACTPANDSALVKNS
jgi:hypothetical protein